MTVRIDLRLWGKSRGLTAPYPLAGHGVDAAAIAEALWDGYLTASQRRIIEEGTGLSVAQARAFVALLAALHDLGKAIPGFQRQDAGAFATLLAAAYPDVPDALPTSHERASHLTVPGLLLELVAEPSSKAKRVAERIGQVLGGHHGVFGPACREATDATRILAAEPSLGGGLWDTQRRALLRELHRAVGEPPLPVTLKPAAAVLIAAVVVVADWLASQETVISERLAPADGLDGWWAGHVAYRRERAGAVVAEAGLRPACWRDVPFGQAFGLDTPPRPVQQSLLDELPGLVREPGLLLVTVPTGEGKTEAALLAARLMGRAAGAPGLFFALPTMATADQMFGRVAGFAERCLAADAGLTLAHGMAWLNDAYANPAAPDDRVLQDHADGERVRSSSTAAEEWLRGRRRAILAPLSVGTIDQVLAAVVRGRHNALRLLGLAGKVLVVDEVHAYDAYMHALLRRLLHWLGAMRVPVVLLSATLSGRIARQLAGDYLAGCGVRPATALPTPPYPGWLYADAGSGETCCREVRVERSWRLAVESHQVWPAGSGGRDRDAVLRDLLTPVTTGGGCAAVVCNTVGEAQQTFVALREWFDGLADAPELFLLHARFPAWRRAEITDEVLRRFGKDATDRPRAAVLVATQVVEQSLDIDFDFLVSDLAPLALLLQRAGRCWRHPGRDRRWTTGPRLAVLVPAGDGGRLRAPRTWTGIYPESLLRRTAGLLDRLDGPVAVPGQVQELVDAVYAEDFAATDDPDTLAKADLEMWGQDAAAGAVADLAAIPQPRQVGSLAGLSNGDVDDDLLGTRLGADSARVLCCYADEGGTLFLDARRTRELPTHPSGKNQRFSRSELRQIVACTVPLRTGHWQRGPGITESPPAWSKHWLLRHLTIVSFQTGEDGVGEAIVAGARWYLDERLGVRVTTSARTLT